MSNQTNSNAGAIISATTGATKCASSNFKESEKRRQKHVTLLGTKTEDFSKHTIVFCPGIERMMTSVASFVAVNSYGGKCSSTTDLLVLGKQVVSRP